MKWFHAGDGTPAGPFDSADIYELVREGTIKPETLVWHEGMAEWKPFGEASADLEPLEEPEDEPELAEERPKSELQHRAEEEDAGEGGEGSEGSATAARLQRRLREGRGFSIREAFSRGWETVAHRPVLMIGCFLLYVVGSMVSEAAYIFGVLISAPLLAGVYGINLRALRNQPVALGDLLTPAKRSFMAIVMVQLVVNVAVVVLAAPFYRQQTMVLFGQTVPAATVDFFHSAGGWMALAAILYLFVMYLFALPLVIDQRCRSWEAILWSFRFTSRHFLKVLLFGILLAVFAFAGFFIFLIGFVLTMPICIAAICAAYLRLFTPDDSGAPLPPSPPGAAAPPDLRQ